MLEEIMGQYYDKTKTLDDNFEFFLDIAKDGYNLMGRKDKRDAQKRYEYVYFRAIKFFKNHKHDYKKYGLRKLDIKCLLVHDTPYRRFFRPHVYQ